MATYDKYPTDDMANIRAGHALAELSQIKPNNPLYTPEETVVLDFGYGNGAFLKRMQKLSYDVYGLDVHGVDYGIRDWNDSLGKRPFVVTAFDSLEHVPEFDFFFALDPEVFIISTPNRPDWFLDGYKSWRHFKPGEHLHYFNKNSLEVLFKRYGYALTSVGYPEDLLRGRHPYKEQHYNNILTACFWKVR
jgi:hypothetical protein